MMTDSFPGFPDNAREIERRKQKDGKISGEGEDETNKPRGS